MLVRYRTTNRSRRRRPRSTTPFTRTFSPNGNLDTLYFKLTASSTLISPNIMKPTNDLQLISEVDITQIRNTASRKSHLSVSNSSKRLRISPSWYPSFPKDNFNQPSIQSPELQRTKKPDLQTFTENILRGGRLDRTSIKLIARYAFVAYCFLSCIFTTCNLYSFCTHIHTTDPRRPPDEVQSPTMDMSALTNYLLKTIPCCTSSFEPFVLSHDHKQGGVSLVGWLNESDVDSIRTWTKTWQGGLSILNSRSIDGYPKGPISILVTTAAQPGSPSHRNLLTKIKSHSVVGGLSIHLLFTQSHSLPTPNLYLNLARLMAATNWTLLFPGDASKPMAYNFHQSVTRLVLESAEGTEAPVVMTLGSKSYPFPSLSPVLIKRAHSFWCTERLFLNVSRKSDWDECLWQLALEKVGKSVKVNTVAISSAGKALSSTPRVGPS